MATRQLPTPDPFYFTNPDSWPCWKRRFEQNHMASGLAAVTQAGHNTEFVFGKQKFASEMLRESIRDFAR